MLVAGHDVVLLPGHEEHADELVRESKGLEKHAGVAEAAQELPGVLWSVVLVVDLHRGPRLEELRDHGVALREHQHIARGRARRHRELEAVATGVEVHGDRGRLHHPLHRIGERPDKGGQLLVRRKLEADAMEIEQPSRQRERAVVQVRALDRDRGLVRDGRQQLEVALVVRVRSRALRGDRSNGLSMQPERRDHDRPLHDLAPRAAGWELEPHAVALGIVQQDRLVALDRQSPERSCHWALFGLHLLAAVVEVAERERAALGDGDRDVERIDVEGLPDLLEDLAEDFHRVERASDGMADLDERGKETRATLRGEARSDVEVAEEEEGDAGDEEPRLDEDDLHGDDRGKAPQELRAHRAVHPLTRDLVEVHVP